MYVIHVVYLHIQICIYHEYALNVEMYSYVNSYINIHIYISYEYAFTYINKCIKRKEYILAYAVFHLSNTTKMLLYDA